MNNIGFLGGGNMAYAIIKGILKSGLYSKEKVLVTDRSEERRQFLKEDLGIVVLDSNEELLKNSEGVLFAVKPQNMSEVMAEVNPFCRGEQVFLSICAGTLASTIENGLKNDDNEKPRVVRIMPNTPALIGEGMAGIAGGTYASDADIQIAKKIFDAVGSAVIITEAEMNGLTAVTGSGPAFLFYFIEGLVKCALEEGFSEEQSKEMVLQMVFGAASLARTSEHSPAELRRMVTSPGGLTAKGIESLENDDFHKVLKNCIIATKKRGEELEKEAS